jgi:hypothetical protein
VQVLIFHLVVLVVAGKAESGGGRSALKLEFIRRLVGVMTADAIRLHRRMNDLLLIESLLVFMTTQAQIQIGLSQAKTGLGSGHIMAVITSSLGNRRVDIWGRTYLDMTLL